MAGKDYGHVRKRVTCPSLYRQTGDVRVRLYWDEDYLAALNVYYTLLPHTHTHILN